MKMACFDAAWNTQSYKANVPATEGLTPGTVPVDFLYRRATPGGASPNAP